MKKQIQDVVEKVKVKYPIKDRRDIVKLFEELENQEIIEFSVYGRQGLTEEEGEWLQVENYFREIAHSVILDYQFKTTIESIDDIIGVIRSFNKQIKDLQERFIAIKRQNYE